MNNEIQHCKLSSFFLMINMCLNLDYIWYISFQASEIFIF